MKNEWLRRSEIHKANILEPTIWPDGTKVWRQDGKFHRIDGPAIEWSHGGKEWYLNGEKHRVDGPATEWPDGRRWWWLHGKPVTPVKIHVTGQFSS